ncbi:type I methionyl aminopeptidase [bacterium]|nr:type I methionyl aminopeptidase [bacterium]
MIQIKTKEEIQIMEEGARRLAQILEELKEKVRAGISTGELNELAEKLILKSGAKPSFKNYNGFPAALCVSINEEIVHGVPSFERIIQEGDIVSLDLGLFYKGFHSDMAITVGVGRISFEKQRLIRVTKDALRMAIRKVRPGNTTGDIGNTIQRYVESQGFNVVRDLCGHGIGRELHEDPQILNYGKRHTGVILREGMVFCIEPMVTMGSWRIKKAPDGYGFTTQDGSFSAHFEHEVAVTKKGCRVLTKW